MAGKARSGAKRRGRVGRVVERFKTAITTVVLLAAGVLLGSFFQEWRGLTVSEAPDLEVAASTPGRRLKVEVLNGSGDRGAARIIGDLLLARGYDVVTVDNADHFDYPVTHVLDRSGLGPLIREVAAALGADSVALAVARELMLDATVILGQDWRHRVPGR